MHPALVESLADALPLTNDKLIQLQVRVIALENLLAALLVEDCCIERQRVADIKLE